MVGYPLHHFSILCENSAKRYKTYGVDDCGLIIDHFNDARRGLLLGALIEGPDTDGHLYTRHSYL